MFLSLQNGLLHQFPTFKGDVTRDDSQQPLLAQHSVATLEQCCKYSKQCSNNVVPKIAVANRLL